MSKTEQKMPYNYALELAQTLETTLRFGCERTLIAGSIRRKRAEIGDIELVVMPKMQPIYDMFGDVVGERSMLDDVLATLGPLSYTKSGPRFKQFTWEGAPVDLFIASRDTWGCVATIRTGSADFSHWLVTPRKYGGGCPSHLKFVEGRVMYGVQALETPEEADVFKALDLKWVPIENRSDRRWY
jgi:DNA polymerase/3'-5' exonuclease PolX